MTVETSAPHPLTKVLRVLTLIGACLLLMVSLFAALPVSPAPWMDLLCHFSLQYSFAAVIGLVWSFYPLEAGRVTKIVLALALAVNLGVLAPYMIPSKQHAPVTEGKFLKVLQANVLYLNKDTTRFRQLIEKENPDIIFVAEANSTFSKMLAGLRKKYPYQHAHPENNGAFGLAVQSKVPLEKLRLVTFAGAEVPSYFFEVTHEGQKTRFFGLHTMNPLFGVDIRDAAFTGLQAEISRSPKNVVVMGDLNATPWCPALRKLMRAVPQLENTRQGRGLFLSWPTFLPSFMRIPIDITLVSDNIAVQDYRLGPDIGSDHFPVIVTLALEKGK
ncbi:MAG: endonuclease/exonuclease/phosphatase family protein [Alphaproteobacteria bacterium]